MAPPAGQIRPGRYLGVFAIIVVVLYALVFFTGSGQPTPKLGIDLQGGTRVTLTAVSPDGKPPSQDSLTLARQIITDRVNGNGVTGAEIVQDGGNLVITAPGNDGDQLKSLGQAAVLRFRGVLTDPASGSPLAIPVAPPASSTPPSNTVKPSGTPSSSAQPSTSSRPSAPSTTASAKAPKAQGAPMPPAATTTASPRTSAAGIVAPKSGATPSATPSPSASGSGTSVDEQQARVIAA
ncbi:MAG: protein translocase subunit SecD, partial [Kutzneria sp.]|nr:protein translocase subunit SecD [Kutzneria sp.]